MDGDHNRLPREIENASEPGARALQEVPDTDVLPVGLRQDRPQEREPHQEVSNELVVPRQARGKDASEDDFEETDGGDRREQQGDGTESRPDGGLKAVESHATISTSGVRRGRVQGQPAFHSPGRPASVWCNIRGWGTGQENQRILQGFLRLLVHDIGEMASRWCAG